ncbi:MAG: ABC transporter ATP-binding protein, partial [Pseudonocardiales bacterium]|nr:ABC transporter ATP-binding protein [Pseudonocardiales bacterium]
ATGISAVACPQGVRVELAGTEAPTVVAVLVGAGVAVHEARRQRTGLDELFAKLTEGKGQ